MSSEPAAAGYSASQTTEEGDWPFAGGPALTGMYWCVMQNGREDWLGDPIGTCVFK